jgi:hypothetical protein
MKLRDLTELAAQFAGSGTAEFVDDPGNCGGRGVAGGDAVVGSGIAGIG